MRIRIYKSYEMPDLTLLLREGIAIPATAEKQKWEHFKSVMQAELKADLLSKIEAGNGCVFVRL
ncbi:hypothetical protein QO002_005137 [Pararhizobium capsulatum DSM 1112]|uniref:Uncharacterized protein n=1 Tax=Pararhizobium capsulatum DSM 1112 TaxID=1121113 RepID=A0ABU0BXE3_9HYPH|nr:hypothetical protein [Pararhizobium capsulatum]MDQ0322931.1 hypothetical protein [Pararhizobium capsulatum DSM 1112]